MSLAAHHPIAQRIAALAEDERARQALAVMLPYLRNVAAEAANPDQALIGFERLLLAAPDRTALFVYLAAQPRACEMLVTIFAGSQFLTEILLRQPDAALQLLERHAGGDLNRRKSLGQFQAEAVAAIGDRSGDDALNALRRYQRWQLLRIGTCDFLGLIDHTGVTTQLSRLADAMVRVCLDLALRAGNEPAADSLYPDSPAAITAERPVTGRSRPYGSFVILAMGKLGGGEVNYSSDIDLLFLTGNSPGHEERAIAEGVRLGQKVIDALARATTEGFLYRVDMRLRPWGRDGALVTQFDGHLEYLRRHARLWEKQALLKARPIAGDLETGEAFLAQAQPLIFALDAAAARADVHAMKQRTEAYLRQHGRAWGEVKLGEGSIRDAEFVVQYLQLAYGSQNPYVRSGRTLDALSRLFSAGLLDAGTHRTLGAGYVFLRTVEHHLQLMHYRQTSTLPASPAELDALARRLGFTATGPQNAGAHQSAGAQFVARYEQHRHAIRRIYNQYLGSESMESPSAPFAGNPAAPNQPASGLQHANAYRRHVERLDPSYAAIFTEAEIQMHAALADRLDDATLVQVHAAPLLPAQSSEEEAAAPTDTWRVTIVGYDYLGELSLICGLLFVYGLDILSGNIFTYEPLAVAPAAARRKIVDVFTVRPLDGQITPELWASYAEDLARMVRKLHFRRRDEAHGYLAHRVAAVLKARDAHSPGATGAGDPLTAANGRHAEPKIYPIDIVIDNESSERYTLLEISGADTPGFLYELTNALALYGSYIARVDVSSAANRVQDTLFIVDANGHKITDTEKQRELRAAIALVKHFTHLLPLSPNPELALLQFRAFLTQLFQHPQWADELASIERPEVLDALARLLGVSDFLWNDFLRMQYANLFPVVRDVGELAQPRAKAELAALLQATWTGVPLAERGQKLNAFKDREMFRIDMRHILGHTARFGQFSRELTALTEVVVEGALQLALATLAAQHFGEPTLADGAPSPLVVLALGKAGGHELGFASDIELMFVYAGQGFTTGPQVFTTAEYYDKLVAEFVQIIHAKREGIFEIDLQLRPYGQAGSLAVSLEAFRRYFAPEGPAWPYERQALVKLRPIAGDATLGQQVTALRDAFVYTGAVFDVAAMRAMRERQWRHLVTPGAINAKFSPGCLVDVEYLVQALQITYGHDRPELRLTNTREAMVALRDAGILSQEDFARLRLAHIFLRNLINALRMVRGHAKDLTVPAEGSAEFAFLARRLGLNSVQLREEMTQHLVAVQELSERLGNRLLEQE